MKKLTLLSSLATAAILALPLLPREAQARPTGGRATVSGPSHSFAGHPAFGNRGGTGQFSNGVPRFNNGGPRFNNGGPRFNNGGPRFNNGTTGFNGNGRWNGNGRGNGNGRWTGNGNWNGDWRHHHHHHHHHGNVFVGFYPYDYGYPWGWYGYGYYPYGSGYYDSGYYDSGYYDSDYYGNNYRSNDGNLAARIQQALARNGYYRGPIDGVIGPRTRMAIRAYERANGLPVDGLIDRQLIATMGLG